MQAAGIGSCVLTDINNTSGCIDFIRKAPSYNIRPSVGVDFRNGIHQQFVAIAKNNEGFSEINRYLSGLLAAKAEVPPIAPDFKNVFVIYPFSGKTPSALKDHEYVGIKASELAKLNHSPWKDRKDKLVILHSCTFKNKLGFNLHRLLRAIDNNTLLSKLPPTEQADAGDQFLPPALLEEKFAGEPLIIENSRKLINGSSISFEFNKVKNKEVFSGSKEEDKALLRKLCYEGLKYRYKKVGLEIEVRVEKELDLIFRQGFCAYFLINWDIVRYASEKGFFYVGRGSGANSIVAYCLKITDVDPIDLDLYFERFINEFRQNPPDFDIDFSWKDRDEIINYLFNKYTTEHTCLLGTYNTLQSSAVIRELGKVFGLPKAEIDELVENRKHGATPDHIASLIFQYGKLLIDFPTHLSIHAGGVLITEASIYQYTATHLPPKGLPVSQFSMLEAEDIGIYKLDILSQRGLGHIKDTIELVKKNRNEEIDIRDIAKFKEDEKIKHLLREGKAMGCFYVESPAMRMLLKKLRVDHYPGLVAASSIIRPGVAQSGMMREYILRFRDPAQVRYIDPLMKELMEETFGIMVYQEDVIKVAHHFAGLSLGEADVLRRGMSGKYRGREEFQKAEQRFIEGAQEKGHSEAITKEVWRQIKSFAGYSFSKGHSASYAVESYQSLFLKAYYPHEFMVGVINNFGGFYRTEYYVHEAKMGGANVHPPCINKSEQLTTIEGKDIYLGFVHMENMEEKVVLSFLQERNRNGLFKDLKDFTDRVAITIEQLRLLIRIGAFRFTGKKKKALLWEMYNLLGSKRKSEPRASLFESPVRNYALPELHYTPFDDALDEWDILGFSLGSPFDLLKELPPPSLNMADLMQHIGKTVELVAYLVCTKTTRTINGEEMYFGTFYDREGVFLDTTHFPPVARKYPFRGKGCYLIKGKVAEEFEYPSIEVHYMEKLPLLSLEAHLPAMA